MDAYDLIVSYSEIKNFRLCIQKHHYQYHQGLSPKSKDYRLAMGDVVHGLTETHARGGDIKETLTKFDKQYSKMFEEEGPKDLVKASYTIFKGYVRRWKDQPLTYTHIEETLGPIKLINDIGFKFRADGVVLDTDGSHWLLERKTKGKFREVALKDLQTALYIWALRSMGIPVEGVLWDEIRTKLPVKPEVLKNGQLSKRKNIDTDWYTYRKRVKELGLDPKNYLDMKRILKGKEATFYKRTPIPIRQSTIENVVRGARATALQIQEFKKKKPIMELSFTCNFCEFKRICEAKLDGLDTTFMIKADFTTRKRRKGGKKED